MSSNPEAIHINTDERGLVQWLEKAARKGQTGTVIALVKTLHVDPGANNGKAIEEAEAAGHTRIADFLKRAKESLTEPRETGPLARGSSFVPANGTFRAALIP